MCTYALLISQHWRTQWARLVVANKTLEVCFCQTKGWCYLSHRPQKVLETTNPFMLTGLSQRGGMMHINTRKHDHSPAVLWGIQCQEVHTGKDSGQGVEVRCQTGWELAPGGEEQHHRALGAVSIQVLHQVLNKIWNKDIQTKGQNPLLWHFVRGIKTDWLCFMGIISIVRSCLLHSRWLQ